MLFTTLGRRGRYLRYYDLFIRNLVHFFTFLGAIVDRMNGRRGRAKETSCWFITRFCMIPNNRLNLPAILLCIISSLYPKKRVGRWMLIPVRSGIH